MTGEWKMPDLYGEPKYTSFSRKWMNVPVQFGKMSARPRQVIFLGAIGSIPRLGKRESYYRIGRGQKGAGRFFVERRRKDEEGRLWIQTYYLRLSDLPGVIQDAIKKNEGEYHDWGSDFADFEKQVEADLVDLKKRAGVD